jgi:putative hydrolase of the HAD superfamily
MLRAVCFDLDGTLFDDRQYARAGLEQAAEVLRAKTGHDLRAAFLKAYFQRGVREATFNTVLEEEGISTEYVADLVKAYHDHNADLVPFPETEAVLDELSTEYALGLITGGTNGQSKVRRLGLDGYFDVVLVTPELGTTKREPEPFESALSSLKIASGECAFVGDRPSLDFPQPNRMGMTTVRVRSSHYAEVDATGDGEPDYTIFDLEELPDLLAGLERTRLR